MGIFSNEQPQQGGSEILARTRSSIAEESGVIRRVATADEYAERSRRRLRIDAVENIERIVSDSRRAFGEWRVKETAGLERRLTAIPNGDQATETRRLRQANEVDRLIATARSDPSTVVVDGQTMTRTQLYAIEHAKTAKKALTRRDYATAQIYARASVELGVDTHRVLQAAEDQIYPDRAKAHDGLDALEIAELTFESDVTADTVAALNDAATAAEAIDDDPNPYRAKMTDLSFRAKSAAWKRSKKQGTKYVEPSGLLPAGPTGGTVRDERPTVHNLDTGETRIITSDDDIASDGGDG